MVIYNEVIELLTQRSSSKYGRFGGGGLDLSVSILFIYSDGLIPSNRIVIYGKQFINIKDHNKRSSNNGYK